MQRTEESQPNLKQGRIINKVNLFLANTIYKNTGIKLNENGVCAGLAALYLKAKSKGKSREFFAFLSKLSSLRPEEYESEKENITIFCSKLLRAQEPSKYHKHSLLRQGDLDQFIFDREKGEEREAIERGATIAVRWDVNLLNRLLGPSIPEDYMVYLSGNKHAIAAYKKFNKYYIYDPNSEDGEVAFTDINECSNYVKKCLFAEKAPYIDITLRTFSYKYKHKPVVPHEYPSKAMLAELISPALDPGYAVSLKMACQYDDVDMVRELLNRGADPVSGNDLAHSPLYHACIFNSGKCIQFILSHVRSIPENYIQSCLYAALDVGNVLASLMLLDYIRYSYPAFLANNDNIANIYRHAFTGGSLKLIEELASFSHHALSTLEVREHAFFTAADNGYTDLIKFLQNNFPPVKNRDLIKKAINAAISNDHFTVFTELMKIYGPPGSDELRLAIEKGRGKIITSMISQKITIGLEHILLAFETRNFQIVMQLLDAKDRHKKEDKKIIRLLRKSLKGDSETCSELLRQFHNDKFAQELYLMALVSEKKSLVAALKANNVKFNGFNKNVGDELIAACRAGDEKTVRNLLSEGANPVVATIVEDHEGKSQIQSLVEIAMYADAPQIVALLLQQGVTLDEDTIKFIAVNAVDQGHINILMALRKYVSNFNQLGSDPLSTALNAKQFACFQYLTTIGLVPTPKHVIKICKLGQIDLLRDVLLRFPEIRNLFTDNDIGKQLVDAARANSSRGIECLLTIKTLSREEYMKAWLEACKAGKQKSAEALIIKANPTPILLYECLMTACKQHHAGLANMLMKYRAHFHKNEDYRELLYSAYGIQCDENNRTDKELMQQASIYGHGEIYNFIASNRKYLDEIREDRRHSVLNLQIEQINPRHLRKSTDKHARHQLFRFDPYQSLQAACRKGNLKAVINLIENEKVSWEGNSIDFIALAADRNHSAVCAYLASHLNESKKQECLAASLRSQSFPLVVALLENMKDYDLSSSLLKQVLAYQNEIRKTFFQLLLLANTQGNEADVKVRNENVRDHKNALALVLGSELKIVKDHTINKNP